MDITGLSAGDLLDIDIIIMGDLLINGERMGDLYGGNVGGMGELIQSLSGEDTGSLLSRKELLLPPCAFLDDVPRTLYISSTISTSAFNI